MRRNDCSKAWRCCLKISRPLTMESSRSGSSTAVALGRPGNRGGLDTAKDHPLSCCRLTTGDCTSKLQFELSLRAVRAHRERCPSQAIDEHLIDRVRKLTLGHLRALFFCLTRLIPQAMSDSLVSPTGPNKSYGQANPTW